MQKMKMNFHCRTFSQLETSKTNNFHTDCCYLNITVFSPPRLLISILFSPNLTLRLPILSRLPPSASRFPSLLRFVLVCLGHLSQWPALPSDSRVYSRAVAASPR